MEDSSFKDLFDRFNEFLQVKEKKFEEIQRKGQNDYNILSITNKNSDELMHSKILASLLDVNGLHYQGDLFLKKFLEIINIKDFDTKNATVEIEKSGDNIEEGRIDIYITDENKHIIIENKVNAKDQKEQLKRYISIIKNKNNEKIKYKDIIVVYLSKNRERPKNLEKYYFFENNILKDIKTKTSEALYKPIYYKNEILKWLDKCLKEVYNISNLREAIITYKQIVEKIVGKYQKKGILMSNFLVKNPDCIKYAYTLNKNFSKMMGEVIFKFLQELDEYTINKCKLENVNSQIEEKYIYNLSKCKKWFDKGTKDRKDIGSFFRLDNEFLLFFWFGDYRFHIGVRGYEEKSGKISFVDKKINDLFAKLEPRDWGVYTKHYGNFLNDYNFKLQECLENKICQIKKDIEEVVEFFKKAI